MRYLTEGDMKINQTIIECVQGDITKEKVDAIVNAANEHLAGGGGVDGAIHRAGGPSLMAELKAKYKGCPTGSAVITGGGNLNCKYVIHAVGPRWKGGLYKEAELLAGAYHESLELSKEHNCKSVAFPAISAGVYGYPMEEAAKVAIKTVTNYIKINQSFEKIRFVLFDADSLAIYQKTTSQFFN